MHTIQDLTDLAEEVWLLREVSDGNGLAGQFWQMESALVFAFKILYMQLILMGKLGQFVKMLGYIKFDSDLFVEACRI